MLTFLERILCHLVTWIWTVLEATEWHVNDAMTVRKGGPRATLEEEGEGVG